MHFSAKATVIALFGVASTVQACTVPKANQATVDLVAEFEGFVPNVYKDAVGKQTVGYGHLCRQAGCSEVPYPIPLSVADGKQLLSDDMSIAESCITYATAASVTLNANQYGALVSWSFNVGCPNARKSDLIKGLNAGNTGIVAVELPKWNKAGGKVLPGLTRRRQAELDLYNTATGDGALPAGC